MPSGLQCLNGMRSCLVSNPRLLQLGLTAAHRDTSKVEQWWELDMLGTQLWPPHPIASPA